MKNTFNNGQVKLTKGFSIFDKITMCIAFYGYIIIGAYGIFSLSVTWGLIYTAFVAIGFMFIATYALCSRCPYPYQYSDCLFMPPIVIKSLYKYRPGPMSFLDKIGFIVIFAGSILIPQYWLVKNYLLLVIFWIFCLPAIITFPVHYCRRCLHFECPFNSVKRE